MAVPAISATRPTRAAPNPTRSELHTMTTADKKKLLITNAALWIAAILLPPLSRILPTGPGGPPKIYEVLIPVLVLMLAGASTYLLSAAIGKPKDG